MRPLVSAYDSYSKMDATRDYHTKWSRSERERQMPYDIAFVESKIWHKWIYETETESET